MTTIVIKNKTKAARDIIDFLKKQSYAKVIEDDEPNNVTLKAVEEARKGKTIKCESFEDYLSKVK